MHINISITKCVDLAFYLVILCVVQIVDYYSVDSTSTFMSIQYSYSKFNHVYSVFACCANPPVIFTL